MKKLILLSTLLFAVNIVRAQWEPDVRLTNDPFVSNNYSQHGIASSGDSVHVVWYDDRDGNNEIYYRRSIDGGLTWATDTRLTYDSHGSMNAAIELSGSVVHVSWSDDRDGNYEVYYKRSTDGGNSWEDDTRITNTPAGTYVNCISVSYSLVHIVYQDVSNGWWNVYYKRSTDSGLTWDPDVQITNTTSSSINPTLCANGDELHIVWNDNRNGNSEIYYKRSTDDGMTWEFDTRLTNDISTSKLPCVGVSGSDVYIVWDDNRDGNSEIYFKHSSDGGLTWGEDYRLTNTSGESEFPNISVSGLSIFVVWTDNSDGNREIYYKCSTDGGINWGPDIRLTNDPAESKYSYISISGSQINVTWTDYRDGNFEIYYKRDPTGGFPVGIYNESTVNSDMQISIYPNPACTILNIDFNSLSDEILDMRIIDMFGRAVGIYKFNSSKGLNQYKTDLNELSEGLYLIELTADEQKYSGKLLIRN